MAIVCYNRYVYIHRGEGMVITFCGHADYLSNLEDEKTLLNLLEEVINGEPVDFYLGGYGGFDAFALNCAKRYKERHNNSKLIFITPYLDKRLEGRKNILFNIYDDIIYPELEYIPRKLAIIKRNEWMITKADYVFCYVRTHYGGAYKAMLYADKLKKKYINIYKGDYSLY